MDGGLRTILDRFTWVGTWLNTVLKPWGWAIAAQELSGKERLTLWGYNATTAIAGEPVWEVSTAYTWAVADQTITLQSTSADDDGVPGGLGAWTVRIWWMNAAGVESFFDAVMDGVAAVVTGIVTARRINKMQVLTCGGSGTNVGTITAYWTDGVTVFRSIPAGRGHSEGLIQSVPAGKRDVIAAVQCDYSFNSIVYTLFTRASPTSPWLARDRVVQANTTKYPDILYYCPLVLPAGTDYYMQAAHSNTLATSAFISGWRETA
jgi:hypothetical protein